MSRTPRCVRKKGVGRAQRMADVRETLPISTLPDSQAGARGRKHAENSWPRWRQRTWVRIEFRRFPRIIGARVTRPVKCYKSLTSHPVKMMRPHRPPSTPWGRTNGSQEVKLTFTEILFSASQALSQARPRGHLVTLLTSSWPGKFLSWWDE